MKLIRDKYDKLIPAERLHTETDKDMQYNYLRSKICEELQELIDTDCTDVYEWADLHEALFAMQQFKGIQSDQVREAQLDKFERLGGFEKFLILKSEPKVDETD